MRTSKLLMVLPMAKEIKKIIAAIIIIFCYLHCDAQQVYLTPAQWMVIHQGMIKNVNYIFEGKVIKQTSISKTVYTCSVVQITKIYKGSPQLKLGTVKVITEQSSMMQDGPVGLSNGSKYIIFAKPTNSDMFDSVITSNTFTFVMSDPIVFYDKYFDLQLYNYVEPAQYDSLTKLNHHLIRFNRPAAQWDGTKYNKVDSLYSFFRENGLEIQEQVAPADSTMKH